VTKSQKLEAGTLVAGRYRVEREIGRGGMAQVYEAKHIEIGKRVAVKVLAAEFITSPVVVERFLREARAAAAVRSPYICDVYDSGKLDDDRPFLVMELLVGESLYERMVRVRQFDAATTTRVMTHVARGLMKAHAVNVVHRDLKPENIFLTTNEEGEMLAKVLDFGLAKFYAPTGEGVAQARLTREGAVFGTPAYMSPEQVQGQGTVDHRADVWALGCITFEAFTGRTVWSTDKGIAMTFAQIASAPLPSILKYRPDLPPAIEKWFGKALARDVEDRFQSAKEFADALAVALEQAPTQSMLSSTEASRVDNLIASALEVEARALHAAIEPAPSGGPTPPPSTRTPGPPPADHEPASISLASLEQGHDPPPTEKPPTTPQPRSSGQRRLPTDPPAVRREPLPALRWPLGIAAALGAAVGGVMLWQMVKSDPTNKPVIATTSTVAAPPASSLIRKAAPTAPVSATATAEPPANGPRWAPLVLEGQARLLAGDFDEAAKKFKEAQDSMGSGPGKAMLDQVSVARENKGPCKLTALARLRPFAYSSQSTGRPDLVTTEKGLLAFWADDHESLQHDHVYAQLLDPQTLRPLGGVVDASPEADRVGRHAAVVVGNRVALLYTDRGTTAGLYLRWLGPDGAVTAPSVAVAGPKAVYASPSLVVQGSTLWAAWEEKGELEQTELFVGKLAPESPTPGARLTDLRKAHIKPRVIGPQIDILGDSLQVVFRADRDALHPVNLLRVSTTDASLATGLLPAPPAQKDDRVIGQLLSLGVPKDRTDTPGIACTKEGCIVVWHIEPSGTIAAWSTAFIGADKSEVTWTKRYTFAGQGGRPAIGVQTDGSALAVWYDNNHILLAPIGGRDGLGTPSSLGHVASDRPPAVVAGLAPKSWAVAWLDFEKGRLEPYALRATCP
jgi:serine/threonine-protein kinase